MDNLVLVTQVKDRGYIRDDIKEVTVKVRILSKRYYIILMLVFFQNFAHADSVSGEYTVAEHKLKLAFIFKFLDSIDNYEELYQENDRIMICILGNVNEGELEAFTDVPSRVAKEKTIMVKILPKNIHRCNVLYYTNMLDDELDTSLKSVKKGVVTISDMPYFTKRGGMISFYKYRNRIGFKINNNVSREGVYSLMQNY